MKKENTNLDKIVKFIIVIVSLIIVCLCSYFLFNTKDYWVTWFNTKQQKLELRDEKSVDSLLNVIDNQQKIIEKHEEFYSEKYCKTIDSLKDIINTQNVTIADNKRAIKQYREVIDNQNKLINK